MKLPRPHDASLAGTVWLARIVAKARLVQSGELPPDYAARFCHASGVDGQFIRFFSLSKEEILTAGARDDRGVAEWFLSHADRQARVAEWNTLALNLGRAGYPMAERLPIALATTYSHLASRKLETVFEVLDADEQAG